MKILDGAALASFIKERQAHQVASLSATWPGTATRANTTNGAAATHGVATSAYVTGTAATSIDAIDAARRIPHLLIIRDSDHPVIAKYVELKKRYGSDIGVTVTDKIAQTPDEIAKAIQSANQDPSIHGIILQLPIQDQVKTDALTALITPEKDVDGLSGSPNAYDSATATAILWLLAGYDIDLQNSKIALVGRGKLVGAPLYRMFTASNCTVELFHRGSDLTNLKKFDIIISATGQPGLILDDYVKPGAVVVDAGTASEKGILKGDLSPAVRARTDLKAITPEKGGVGPLTVACLFDHVIQAASRHE